MKWYAVFYEVLPHRKYGYVTVEAQSATDAQFKARRKIPFNAMMTEIVLPYTQGVCPICGAPEVNGQCAS